jgi:hypothetical protein
VFRDDPTLFPPEPYCRRAAWAWIVDHGRHADFLIIIRDLAATWQWTAPKVQRFLAALEARGMIEIVGSRQMGTMIHLADTRHLSDANSQNGAGDTRDTLDADTPVPTLLPSLLRAVPWYVTNTGKPESTVRGWVMKLAGKYDHGMILDSMRACARASPRDPIGWTQFEINKRMGANGHDRPRTAAERRFDADREATLAAVLAREARNRAGNGGGA